MSRGDEGVEEVVGIGEVDDGGGGDFCSCRDGSNCNCREDEELGEE